MCNPSNRMDARSNHISPPTAPTGSTIESALPTNGCNVQPKNQPPPIKSKKAIHIEIFNEPLRPIEPAIDNMVLVAK